MRSLIVFLWISFASRLEVRAQVEAQEQCQVITRTIGQITQLSYSFATGNIGAVEGEPPAQQTASIKAEKSGSDQATYGRCPITRFALQ